MKNLKNIFSSLILFAMAVNSYSCTLINPKHDKGPDLAQHLTLKEEKAAKQFVKIALLLDTSNSMDGLINQAKAQLWDIVNEFTYAKCGDHSQPELKIALYEYGNDNLSSKEGYIRQVTWVQ